MLTWLDQIPKYYSTSCYLRHLLEGASDTAVDGDLRSSIFVCRDYLCLHQLTTSTSRQLVIKHSSVTGSVHAL
ncbi:hypothetical protein J6590_001788 [Homalodisca vitripennis]|nr:hypothetical protein J6590_001788 [Homalodisca vitripennis]